MDSLINGYRRFRAESWPQERARFEELAKHGQRPRIMVIACSDSRVDPQMIFGAAPGELFVVRNVANLVPPYAPDAAYHGTSAALEFAVKALEVEHIVVLGHALCGGIAALLDASAAPLGDFIHHWMAIAAPAHRRAIECTELAPEARQELCEHEAIKVSLANLMTFPWVRARVDAGRLTLHGAYFGVRSGVLMTLGEDGRFAPVAPVGTDGRDAKDGSASMRRPVR
jgi:carbonic anhydrase